MRAGCQDDRIVKAQETPAIETDRRWYAIHTGAHQEKQVQGRLLARGIEPFLPLSRQCRQRSDRKVWTAVPLFGGYCFARFALEKSLVVSKTPGVARIVGLPKPEPILDEEIARFQHVCLTIPTIRPYDYFAEGACVEVIRGPLSGLRGQLVRRSKQYGLVIRAPLIQRAALIHIRADEVVSTR